MKRTFRVHPAAEAELRVAAIYLNERSLGAGDRLLASVGAALRSVSRLPGIGQIIPVENSLVEIRRVRVRPSDYQLIYAVRSDEILVLAVAHTRRRPMYWTDRV